MAKRIAAKADNQEAVGAALWEAVRIARRLSEELGKLSAKARARERKAKRAA